MNHTSPPSLPKWMFSLFMCTEVSQRSRYMQAVVLRSFLPATLLLRRLCSKYASNALFVFHHPGLSGGQRSARAHQLRQGCEPEQRDLLAGIRPYWVWRMARAEPHRTPPQAVGLYVEGHVHRVCARNYPCSSLHFTLRVLRVTCFRQLGTPA